VCSVSRSPDFSAVTTEGEVSEAQRLLTRKLVRDSEMEQCCCGTTVRVYIGAPPTVPIESSRGACERYNEGLRMVTLVI